MAEHEHWQGRFGAGGQTGAATDGAVARLDAALARIAAAAARRQDALRVAELDAQAAQHEADRLLLAEDQLRREAAAQAADAAAERIAEREAERLAELNALADRLDGLIAMVRAELAETGDPMAED